MAVTPNLSLTLIPDNDTNWGGFYRADITTLDTVIGTLLSDKGAANGYAPLGADTLIPNIYLPALAITSTYVAVSEVEQLALTLEEGDVAVRTDLNKSYIALNDVNASMADWQELLTPTDSVTSVNGYVGVVVLTAADVGLPDVDNTSDLDKPISTDTQTALDAKIDETAPTGSAQLPSGTTAERDATPLVGMVRHNAELARYEGWNGSSWAALGGGATGGNGDEVFILNDSRVTTDYTLPKGKNATSVNVKINGDATVIIPSWANLALYSEALSTAPWLISAIIDTNTDLSPFGDMTADTVADINATLRLSTEQQITLSDSTKAYTVSIFIKKDATGRATRFPKLDLVFLGSTQETSSISLDTSTGEYLLGYTHDAATVVGMEDFNTNYWRIWVTATSQDPANPNITIVLYPSAGASAIWTEDFAAQGSVVACGAQIEQSNEISPYIKTTTVQVTDESTWVVF